MVIDTHTTVTQIDSFAPPESLSNPWMDIDQHTTNTHQLSHNVSPTQPDHKEILNSSHDQIPLTSSTSSLTTTSPPNSERSEDVCTSLGSVDDSIHTPSRNKNKRTQTYDARILVSDVPENLPSEKSSWLHSWFLGISSLKHIYVDTIFNMKYFILQFDSLNTMRSLVNKFNNYGSTNAKLVDMNYTKPKNLQVKTLESPPLKLSRL